jgi:hypothetical protein
VGVRIVTCFVLAFVATAWYMRRECLIEEKPRPPRWVNEVGF